MYGVSNSQTETAYDELALLAAELCRAPVALIVFADGDGRYCKGSFGLDDRELALRIIGRAFDLFRDDHLVVPDLAADPRFAGVPGWPFRLYAGARLRSFTGAPIGAVNVLANKPQELSARQVMMLQVVGRQIMARLELHRALRSREELIDDNRRRLAAAEESLCQREVLIHEMNHRIRNSLQLVSSYLSLQGRSTDNPEVRTHLADATFRVAAIGRAHQRLYQSVELSSINLARYLHDLCRDIADGLVAGDNGPTIVVDAVDARFPPDHAISIGLIVTEFITNAVKHAFRGRAGTINVTLASLKEDLYELSVADDGTGMPEGAPPAEGPGIGMKMARALAASLNAEIEIHPVRHGRGTVMSIEFARAAAVGQRGGTRRVSPDCR